jgi:hypothetical protein
MPTSFPEKTMNCPAPVPSISAATVAAAWAVLKTPLPTIELLGPEELHGVAVASDAPKEAVWQHAARRYDHDTVGARTEADGARRSLARHRERLITGYERDERALREMNRTVIKSMPRDPLTFKEWIDLGVLSLLLIAALAASVATIKAIVLDTGIVQSEAQAVALGLVPTLGAFLIARFVNGLPTLSGYRRARRAVNLSAMTLVGLWTVLFATVFATGATAGIDDIVAGLASGETAPSVNPFLERAFFIVAVLFEILVSAAFEMSLEQTLMRGQRFASDPCGIYSERKNEFKHVSTELGEVEDADTKLAARLATIEAGRLAYADACVGMLFCPSATASTRAGVRDHTAPSTKRPSGRHLTTQNGKTP